MSKFAPEPRGREITPEALYVRRREFLKTARLRSVQRWLSELMVPLALTSTSRSIRRLGFRRWQRLHQLAYLAGVLAVVHFIWRVKIDVSQPMYYAYALAVLLLVRLVFWLRSRPGPIAR